MRFERLVTDGAPKELTSALASIDFALVCLGEVAERILGVAFPADRPAEFSVGLLGFTTRVLPNIYGVQVSLGDVSCTREPRQFHEALNALKELALNTVCTSLREARSDITIQVRVLIAIDEGAVPLQPGSNEYGSFLEKVFWVTAKGEVR